jgi:hypothetical protein
MSIENADVIDIEIALKDDAVQMVIVDDSPWGVGDAAAAHLTLIHRKINRYLDHAETEEFRVKYPRTNLNMITIALILRYQPSAGATDYLEQLTEKLAVEEGVTFVFAVDED